jgi:hypothetical protein
VPARKKPLANAKPTRAGATPRLEVVSFDLRRNLIQVLGEEHYPYAEFLYHELVANAWDEDASSVHIVESVVRPAGRGQSPIYEIAVLDNGNGMDLPRLREYFTVGESGKLDRKISDRLSRPLIGRIGVGKVAILKAARSWRITTERHLDVEDPVRLRVRVDIDEWIAERVPGFAVEFLEPSGVPGTEIVLEGVQVKLRQDRILRHLQRLPLDEGFMVWRNGELIPPRRWFGVDRIPIDEEAEWAEADGTVRRGRIRGEVWIRPETAKKREQAYLLEPKTEDEGLRREPAGIEVRVNRDMITRDFFGHESHGHQVNRIWGFVDADWLPILGNRTDYLRDHPAGHAFYNAVKPFVDQAFNRVRYENERRGQEQRDRRAAAARSGGGSSRADVDNDDAQDEGRNHAGSNARPEPPPTSTDEAVATRYGEGVKKVLEAHPEITPVVETPAKATRGRPANDRIYPARPAGVRRQFVAGLEGTDLALTTGTDIVERREVTTGSALRGPTDESSEEELADIKVNTSAGVRIRFVPLGSIEAPYRWNLGATDQLSLDINTDHKLYQEAGRPTTASHRLHCAWMIAMALTERTMNGAGERFADLVESLSYELFAEWTTPRST